MRKLRLGMLISGGGTTMASILESCKTGKLAQCIDPVIVIASNSSAKGLSKAHDAGISSENLHVIDPIIHGAGFGTKLLHELTARNVDIVGQYGWLPRTPLEVIQRFPNAMINQHPGPLDIGREDFGGKGMYGRRVHCARLLFVRRTKRDSWTEVVAQLVDPEFDKGQVIAQSVVIISSDDTVETLQARALEMEHEVQIKALGIMAKCFGGTIPTERRDGPLIRSDEEAILAECKQTARLLYPNG